jgi:hypothetical protein
MAVLMLLLLLNCNVRCCCCCCLLFLTAQLPLPWCLSRAASFNAKQWQCHAVYTVWVTFDASTGCFQTELEELKTCTTRHAKRSMQSDAAAVDHSAAAVAAANRAAASTLVPEHRNLFQRHTMAVLWLMLLNCDVYCSCCCCCLLFLTPQPPPP